ncbi:DnaD domain protein, partial [Staphylococcus saprophyticus]|uniref:DnaD domain protein n=1 Tax=Staphylococcus saprophyticus TaxID=29385 RepID=UPI00370463DC
MNLNQFYLKLTHIIQQLNIKLQQQNTQLQFNLLFQQIQQPFPTPLSPFQIQTLNQSLHIHKHQLSVIQPPLHQPTSHNNLTFKYIHPILLNSKKNDLKTIQH